MERLGMEWGRREGPQEGLLPGARVCLRSVFIAPGAGGEWHLEGLSPLPGGRLGSWRRPLPLLASPPDSPHPKLTFPPALPTLCLTCGCPGQDQLLPQLELRCLGEKSRQSPLGWVGGHSKREREIPPHFLSPASLVRTFPGQCSWAVHVAVKFGAKKMGKNPGECWFPGPLRVSENKASVRSCYRDFPGSAVVKNPPSNAGDAGSIPDRGIKIPHAYRATKPSNHGHSTCATTRERSQTLTRDSPHTTMKDLACHD